MSVPASPDIRRGAGARAIPSHTNNYNNNSGVGAGSKNSAPLSRIQQEAELILYRLNRVGRKVSHVADTIEVFHTEPLDFARERTQLRCDREARIKETEEENIANLIRMSGGHAASIWLLPCLEREEECNRAVFAKVESSRFRDLAALFKETAPAGGGLSFARTTSSRRI
eukprot:PhM_4_TR9905/c0_g1_i1/m.6662